MVVWAFSNAVLRTLVLGKEGRGKEGCQEEGARSRTPDPESSLGTNEICKYFPYTYTICKMAFSSLSRIDENKQNIFQSPVRSSQFANNELNSITKHNIFNVLKEKH